eukprot:CAMPEP_0168358942 /NCGR_PEP_ID=MMETSP0228-20121227/1381_1 /TAXON_ID=133427 /ORGANISM="Protoceratium reticulatum, Strain CCCM 535 (=CCMP 1889)" /LENGTH=94 /DNA_ID=CAMNT_0008371545 /DNA_START=126 /DNA_END=408 /DNA_ORIENTATION=-
MTAPQSMERPTPPGRGQKIDGNRELASAWPVDWYQSARRRPLKAWARRLAALNPAGSARDDSQQPSPAGASRAGRTCPGTLRRLRASPRIGAQG